MVLSPSTQLHTEIQVWACKPGWHNRAAAHLAWAFLYRWVAGCEKHSNETMYQHVIYTPTRAYLFMRLRVFHWARNKIDASKWFRLRTSVAQVPPTALLPQLSAAPLPPRSSMPQVPRYPAASPRKPLPRTPHVDEGGGRKAHPRTDASLCVPHTLHPWAVDW